MTYIFLPPRPAHTLPPDPEGMNDRRARWAEFALRAFAAATGTDRGDLIHFAGCYYGDFELFVVGTPDAEARP